MKRILLVLTGSVATIKYKELIKTLSTSFVVDVLYTESAKYFLNQYELLQMEEINEVYDNNYTANEIKNIQHINLSKKLDLILICPATYDFINKYKNGIADNFILSLLAAYDKNKVLIVPAMNTNMYLNNILQENISFLEKKNVAFMEPETGVLACKDVGIGKMPEIKNIMNAVEKKLNIKRPKNIVITCGATRLDFDPVRFITNNATGTFGKALAKEAINQFYNVILIHGENVPVNDLPENIKTIAVKYNYEVLREIKQIEQSDKIDALIMNMAPIDYISTYSEEKIKVDKLTYELEKDIDILKELKTSKFYKIGFAVETNNLIENGKKKLKSKYLDIIYVNDAQSMGSNKAYNFYAINNEGSQEYSNYTKDNLSEIIINNLNEQINNKGEKDD